MQHVSPYSQKAKHGRRVHLVLLKQGRARERTVQKFSKVKQGWIARWPATECAQRGKFSGEAYIIHLRSRGLEITGAACGLSQIKKRRDWPSIADQPTLRGWGAQRARVGGRSHLDHRAPAGPPLPN
jgi:hypothetical protein